jgi:hypothetical protein
LGVHSTQSIFFENIDIEAVFVATGKVIWKSLLHGRVVADLNKYNYEILTDTIETKLYEMLASKLNKEFIH